MKYLVSYALESKLLHFSMLAEATKTKMEEYYKAAEKAAVDAGKTSEEARTVHNYNWNMDKYSESYGAYLAYEYAAKQMKELINTVERGL